MYCFTAMFAHRRSDPGWKHPISDLVVGLRAISGYRVPDLAAGLGRPAGTFRYGFLDLVAGMGDETLFFRLSGCAGGAFWDSVFEI